ncbi:MAG: hypothetical protein R3Y35_10010 [Clostridia bacterium]
MKIIKCKSNIKTINDFLNSTKVNWRNSVYIECNICKYTKDYYCQDFLFSPNKDGTPIIIPVSDIEVITSRIVDKSECLSVISNIKFQDLYSFWFEQFILSDKVCPYKNIVKQLGKPENW